MLSRQLAKWRSRKSHESDTSPLHENDSQATLVPELQGSSSAATKEPQPSSPTDSFTAAKPEETQQTVTGRKSSAFLANTNAVSKFIEYLSLYGEDGVLLRELLMLVSTTYTSNIKAGESGIGSSRTSVSLEKIAESTSFMHAFAAATSRSTELFAVREELQSKGLITIRNQDVENTGGSGAWAVDSQVWVTGPNREELPKVQQKDFNEELILFFDAAQRSETLVQQRRQMELIYNHARLVCNHLTLKLQRAPTQSFSELGIGKPYVAQLVQLILNVLTHRHRDDDAKVFGSLRSSLEDTDPCSYPESFMKWEWVQAAWDLKFGTKSNLEFIRTIIAWKDAVTSLWSQSTVGFFLEFWIHEFENMPGAFDTKLILLGLGERWCETVSQSRDHQTRLALCNLLPRLKLWDQLSSLPHKYHLDCGYQLSRQGYLDLAERFLLSGFTACEPKPQPQGKYWRYHIELIIVLCRSGRWKEAVDKLRSSLQEGEGEYLKDFREDPDKLQTSGDFTEFKLSASVILADCLLTQMLFEDAETVLTPLYDDIQEMRDQYIVSMRRAIQSRLLQIYLQLEKLVEANKTAIRQCRDLFDIDGNVPDKGTVRWAVDELLLCSNDLVEAGMFSEAFKILDRLVCAQELSPTLLSSETRTYVKSRHNTVSRLSAAGRPTSSVSTYTEDSIDTPSRLQKSSEKTFGRFALGETPITWRSGNTDE